MKDQALKSEIPLIYDALFANYTEAGFITVDPCCNGFIARNTGSVPCSINGIILKPYPPGHPELSGESLTVGGNRGEIYRGKIQIAFLAAGITSVDVIQKYYKPDSL